MTYGVFGAAYVLYAWSLLGVGHRRAGALLLGLAPAVHPVLGAWCLTIGAMALAWEEHRQLSALRGELRWLAAGLVLSCASFAVQWTLSRGLPAVDVEVARELTAIFARDWDNHRVRVPIRHLVVISAACTTALAGIYLRFGRSSLPDRSIVLLRCLTISAPAGLLLSLLTNWQQFLPMPLVMAMPGRFNDVVALAFPALVLSLVARQRSNLAMHALLSLVLVYCLLKTNMMITHRIYVPSAPKVMAALALGLLLVSPRLADGCLPGRLWNAASWHGLRALVLGCLFAAVYNWRRDRVLAQTICIAALAIVALSHSPGVWRRVAAGALGWRVAPSLLWLIDAACLLKISAAVVGPSFTLAAAAGVACLARKEWLPIVARPRSLAVGLRMASLATLGGICVFVGGGKLVGEATAGQARLRNWTNDPVLAAVSRGSGLTLTASRIELMQLQTRRGVLLYGAAMNQLTYVPASAPKINEILQRVYGEDLFAPRPDGWVRCGGLMGDSGRQLWAERDVEEWIALSREFGFTDVVTYTDWTTKLPLVARNTKYALYHVPDSEPVRASYATASSGAAVRCFGASIIKRSPLSLDRLRTRIEPLRHALLTHPLYADLQQPQALRRFMEHHVFAVWDFMALLKALQQRLCCTSVFWIPTGRGAASRFINEIVLGEESDEDGRGGFASHFELYRGAMTAYAADTTTIDGFIHFLSHGRSVGEALEFAQAPAAVRRFVEATFEVIQGGELHRIASAFTFGREDLLPDVFLQIVERLSQQAECGLAEFLYYLHRHIDLDRDEHGPLAARLMTMLCDGDDDKWRQAEETAIAALAARLDFWDAIHAAIKA